MPKLKEAAQGAWLQKVVSDALTIELASREAMTLEILTEYFGFTEEDLNRYADLKMEKMREARDAGRRK